MPKLILPQALFSLFAAFAPCCSEPGFQYFVAFLLNFMAGAGRRTAASAYARSNLSRHWTNGVRWLSRERADQRRPSIAQALLKLLLLHLPLPRDNQGRRRLYLPVDESRVPKSKAAKKMDHLHYWYNPQGGDCRGRYIWGHLWAIVGLLLPIGSEGRLRCFPIAAGLCPPKGKAQRSKDDTSYTARTFFRLLEGISWPAECIRTLIGDGAFACKALLDWCRMRGFFLISHVQLNAEVREVLPPPPTSKRGRPRKWGDRIDLRQVYNDDSRFEALPEPLYEEGVQGSYTALIGVLSAQISIVACALLKLLRTQPQVLGAGADLAAQTLPWKRRRDSFSTNQVRTLLQQACTAELIFRVLALAHAKLENRRVLAALRSLGFGMC